MPEPWAREFRAEVERARGVSPSSMLPLPLQTWCETERLTAVVAAARVTPIDAAAGRWLSQLSSTTARSYAASLSGMAMRIASPATTARELLAWIVRSPAEAQAAIDDYHRTSGVKQNTARHHLGALLHALHALRHAGVEVPHLQIERPERDVDLAAPAAAPETIARALELLCSSRRFEEVRSAAAIHLAIAGLRAQEIAGLELAHYFGDEAAVEIDGDRIALTTAAVVAMRRWLIIRGVEAGPIFDVVARRLAVNLKLIADRLDAVLTFESIRRRGILDVFLRDGLAAAGVFARTRAPYELKRIIVAAGLPYEADSTGLE